MIRIVLFLQNIRFVIVSQKNTVCKITCIYTNSIDNACFARILTENLQGICKLSFYIEGDCGIIQ